MWPLSRKNYPKQFIEIKNNHSIFQATIARNMAFCDEFIIVTNLEYQSIIENQMKAFRGLTYRCIYEETGRNTAAALILATINLPQSELVFVVGSDQLIWGNDYKNAIMEAKKLALSGRLVVINKEMYLYKNGDLEAQMKLHSPLLYNACEAAYYLKKTIGSNVYFDEDSMKDIPVLTIDEALMDHTMLRSEVNLDFVIRDVGGLDDLVDDTLREAMAMGAQSDSARQVIDNKCENTTVINKSSDRMVLVNHLKNVLVVNTDDAVYIGNKGDSNDLKEIILKRSDMWDYFNKSRLFYRKWGNYEVICEDYGLGVQVRKVTLEPGKTIYLHKHAKKSENWTVLGGRGLVTLCGKESYIGVGDNVSIPQNTEHQLSCVSEEKLVFIESSTGVEFKNEDIISVESQNRSESALGYETEPFVLLSPAYKDYLWGGVRLKELYGKETDLECIAESWELSAHPDGQSSVCGGRYDGLPFARYLEIIGDEALGWKYQGNRAFPLMIKLIDANKDLSIQVHPADDYALEHENEYGKSELWYVIDCEPGAYLYCGFNRDVTEKEVREKVADGSIEEILNRIEIEKGGMYYIPAGTIHAIGKGALICEVQQNSNSTYRIYDYDRVDKYGNKRRLDIEKAMDVLDFSKYKGNAQCKYFEVREVKCTGKKKLSMSEESFCALMILRGKGNISCNEYSRDIKMGNCIFIPKRKGGITLTGDMEYIEVRI